MISAAIAYRSLDTNTVKEVNKLLKNHPFYDDWTTKFKQKDLKIPLEIYIFMRASVWPDDIRDSGSTYDHPVWHFINYPLKPPGFEFMPDEPSGEDILIGIDQCRKALDDPKMKKRTKAIYLSWLIHLYGDIHQPLHCTTYTDSMFPKGDKGGNDVFIRPARAGVTLHVYWDGLLGRSLQPRECVNEAIVIGKERPPTALEELNKASDPKGISLESRQLAIEHAYLKGNLKLATTKEAAFKVPDNYNKTAKNVAERRIALSGYRLAKVLPEFFAPPTNPKPR